MKHSIAALALIALAGCAWMYTPRTDITGQQFQYRPGDGVIESVTRAPMPFTAAAGASGSASQTLYRLALRMDDGRRQYIDTDEPGFQPGQRVHLTDGRLIEKR